MNQYTTTLIYENANFALKYFGPEPSEVERVVVSFPDLIHPTGFDAPGWGEAFFTKRNQSTIFVLFNKANWYQSEGFFEAMHAARAFLGDNVKISSYGASMGGYGAILAGKTLKADHVVALCPQYTIQQDIAPFERRYRAQAEDIGQFIHNIDSEIDAGISYAVVYDPTHNIDKRHEALFRRHKNWIRIPLSGSSHGVLPTILEMVPKETILKLTLNNISAGDFRLELRNGRMNSARYIRRMGNLSLPKHPKFTRQFIGYARKKKYFRLVKKWQNALLKKDNRPKLILHPGPPKTDTSAIQMYFKSTSHAYEKLGISYPLDPENPRGGSHSWLSTSLRDGDLGLLEQRLKQAFRSGEALILSDESLYIETPLLNSETRAAIKEILEQYSVRVVVGQRPVTAWQKSFYLQSVTNRRSTTKQGANRLWGTDLTYSAFFEGEFAQKLCDFDTCIADFSEMVGAATVETVTMKSGLDIIPEFCRAAGIPYFENHSTQIVNPSLNDVDGEVQRQANGFSVKFAGFIKHAMRLPTDVNVQNLRPNRVRKLAHACTELPWAKFVYNANPPLNYTQVEFTARVKALEKLAEQITKASTSL